MKTRYKDGLKPYPFCGKQPEYYKWSETLWSVICNCGCESPRESASKNGIKKIWNRRRYFETKKEK